MKNLNLAEFLSTFFPLRKYNFNNSEEVQYVYIMHNPATGLFKIGLTEDPKKRLQQLSTGAGAKLILCHIFNLNPEIDESSKYLEGKLKFYYKRKVIYGEWYRLSLRDVVEIVNLDIGNEGYECNFYNLHRSGKIVFPSKLLRNVVF